MIYQTGDNVPFQFQYTASATTLGKTGLAVTVKAVYRNGAAIPALVGAVVTELGNGLYEYVLAGANVNAVGRYTIIATTADTSVSQRDLAAINLVTTWANRVDADISDIPDVTWDEVLTGATHNIPASAGRRLRQLADVVIYDGTATGGTANTILLNAGASAIDGAYDPALIAIVNGTGNGQSRRILEYEGAARRAWVNRDWKTTPNATSEFIITTDAGGPSVNEGVLRAVGVNTARLNALSSTDNDAYNGQLLFLVSGPGQDQVRTVLDYDGATQTVTVSDWDSLPTTTTCYLMLPNTDPLGLEVPNSYAVGTAGYTLGNIGAIVDATLSAVHGAGLWIQTLPVCSKSGSTCGSDYVWQIYRFARNVINQRGVDLSGAVSYYVTAKTSLTQADSAAVFQITNLAGLTVLNGAVAANPVWGSIVWSGNTASIIISDDMAAALSATTERLYVDIKGIDVNGGRIPAWQGYAMVNDIVTRAM